MGIEFCLLIFKGTVDIICCVCSMSNSQRVRFNLYLSWMWYIWFSSWSLITFICRLYWLTDLCIRDKEVNIFPDGKNLFLYVLFTWSNIFILTKKFDSGRNTIILDIEINAWSWFFVNLQISFFSFNITWRESFMESQSEVRELCAQPMRNQKIKQILSEIQKCPMWICGSGLWDIQTKSIHLSNFKCSLSTL